jgi:hypothetical protein
MAHPLRKLVALSTAGLLFVGGVAAAATGTNPLSPLLGPNADAGPSLTTTTTTTIGTTTTTTEASDDAAVSDDEVICPEGVSNHGEAVSQVAHDTSTTGAEHGAAVSKMAHSDCGKIDDQEEEQEEVAPESPPADDEVVCPEGVRNHGEAVSKVAHDKSKVGAEHGAAVSKMAQSDCGKKSDGSDDGDDEGDEQGS